MEETRRRIIRATVDLHAEHGVLATTYAMIAERADVAIPTAYNHFPTRADLLSACIGHVASQAPAFGPHIYQGLADDPARLAALVRATFDTYTYYSPWLRWAIHEAASVPEIQRFLDQFRAQRGCLIEQAFAPGFTRAPPRALIALADVLLDFHGWKSLTTDRHLRPNQRERLVTDALLALLRHHQRARMIGNRRKRAS